MFFSLLAHNKHISSLFTMIEWFYWMTASSIMLWRIWPRFSCLYCFSHFVFFQSCNQGRTNGFPSKRLDPRSLDSRRFSCVRWELPTQLQHRRPIRVSCSLKFLTYSLVPSFVTRIPYTRHVIMISNEINYKSVTVENSATNRSRLLGARLVWLNYDFANKLAQHHAVWRGDVSYTVTAFDGCTNIHHKT